VPHGYSRYYRYILYAIFLPILSGGNAVWMNVIRQVKNEKKIRTIKVVASQVYAKRYEVWIRSAQNCFRISLATLPRVR
jgi:hypothetical protein